MTQCRDQRRTLQAPQALVSRHAWVDIVGAL